MLRAFFIVVAVLILAVIGVVVYALATQPDTFRVERAININAPTDKIYGIVTDLRRGAEWSPYEKKDLSMKKAFSGPATGPGSQLAWDGNSDVGAGTLTIADATAPSKVVLKLDMTRPMEGHHTIEYDLTPVGGGTRMNWSMHGLMNPVGKVMCLFMNMDKMVGKDFEDGLKSLKALAER
ncbi:MAG: SRPBCC family protein [Pseudorhodoplanes sp.]